LHLCEAEGGGGGITCVKQSCSCNDPADDKLMALPVTCDV